MDSHLPNRKLPRLRGYDYSTENFYFITICTFQRRCIFGRCGELNEWGRIAERDLIQISTRFLGVRIEKYVIMPNHIHAIVAIGCEDFSKVGTPTDFPTLSKIVGLYKAGVTREIRTKIPNVQIWQGSFHDHIIRDENEYWEIYRYIEENQQKWLEDKLYLE